MSQEEFKTKNKIRIVTSASLFDGHDAAINIMRRIMQSLGAEVIHLGHNRTVQEIVNCAIQENAQGIAISSYQGGHVEYLEYMHDLLQEAGVKTKIVAGGGGTILPSEIERLHEYGIERVYSPDDGRQLGLEGMIQDMLNRLDFSAVHEPTALPQPTVADYKSIGQWITLAEESQDLFSKEFTRTENSIPVIGVTGTGGAGKSSLVDELVLRHITANPETQIAILSVDPSKRKTGGALLGDRIRMNCIEKGNVYMRSLATRTSNLAMSPHVASAIDICKSAGFDLIIVETSGIGQSDTEITDHSDLSLYVMTPEYGASTQLEKIDMLDYADLVAINKMEKPGGLDALRDVRKQFQRNRKLWDTDLETLPVIGTMASQFNDSGVNQLYNSLIEKVNSTSGTNFQKVNVDSTSHEHRFIIPTDRNRYLSEIAEYNSQYRDHVRDQSNKASQLYRLKGAMEALTDADDAQNILKQEYKKLEEALTPEVKQLLAKWPTVKEKYDGDEYTYSVRGKEIKGSLTYESLSFTKIPKVSYPKYRDWGDIVNWRLTENFPGYFPFAAGVFPLKRQGEAPTRMFAGEGDAARTNKRFHYLSYGQSAARLSTAFDSVTLYGENPDVRPDIYGKIGNSGVSVATLDEAKILYSGFDLCASSTSVSMTINGPAPMLLAFFLNAAIDQQCEKHIVENGLLGEVQAKLGEYFTSKGIDQPKYPGQLPKGNDGLGLLLLGTTGDAVLPADVYETIKAKTLTQVRGTVQADILKEDQAQNTCIFSTEFALRMMGDIQQYFIEQQIRNFYSVSISGYHIAEAGANPISQLAFTLSNGFTFIEYYLARGMDIDDFAPNFSFFFSNGIDPEYAVIGRVARRIWAKALKHKYKAGERSQKLKYHIQTSGRSLHAQEIGFNDIRTTLQALYAIYDNCNSLHTNAYDEAITTPTEESVRRAVAIQMIIDQELGLTKNENPLQGSFIIEELSDLVEEAVMEEFRRISDRGGVLGAMERMYQRSKIQEESHHYESLKHNGQLPIIGVNTFLDPNGSPTVVPSEVIRSTEDEKKASISSLNRFEQQHNNNFAESIATLQDKARNNQNVFEELMETVKKCSLGQITNGLFAVGGQYRRNM